MSKPIIFFICIILSLPATLKASNSIIDNIDISGYFQLWCIPYEGAENGLQQPFSEQEAAQSAAGFIFRRARLKLHSQSDDAFLKINFQARLEGGFELYDYSATMNFSRHLNLLVGQMKIPIEYESLISAQNLDFIVRSQLARKLPDYTLSRHPFKVSPFYGNKPRRRDLGIGAKGTILGNHLKYFVMLGNGLGANLWVGCDTQKGFITSNEPGDLLYSGRIELIPMSGISIGGHYTYNYHENVIYNEDNVLDIKRKSWSTDLQLKTLQRIKCVFMYAGGLVDDDIDYNGKTDYEYWGWEGRLIAELIKDKLELGLRFDSYSYRNNNLAPTVIQDIWTYGINYYLEPCGKLQLNYMHKVKDNKVDEDLDDDIIFINLHLGFH